MDPQQFFPSYVPTKNSLKNTKSLKTQLETNANFQTLVKGHLYYDPGDED